MHLGLNNLGSDGKLLWQSDFSEPIYTNWLYNSSGLVSTDANYTDNCALIINGIGDDDDDDAKMHWMLWDCTKNSLRVDGISTPQDLLSHETTEIHAVCKKDLGGFVDVERSRQADLRKHSGITYYEDANDNENGDYDEINLA